MSYLRRRGRSIEEEEEEKEFMAQQWMLCDLLLCSHIIHCCQSSKSMMMRMMMRESFFSAVLLYPILSRPSSFGSDWTPHVSLAPTRLHVHLNASPVSSLLSKHWRLTGAQGPSLTDPSFVHEKNRWWNSSLFSGVFRRFYSFSLWGKYITWKTIWYRGHTTLYRGIHLCLVCFSFILLCLLIPRGRLSCWTTGNRINSQCATFCFKFSMNALY